MKAKFSSSLVLQLVLLLGAPLSLSSAYAQDTATPDASAPAVEAAPATDAAAVDAGAVPVDPAADPAAVDASAETSSVASDDAANAATAAEAATAAHGSQFGLKELWEQGDVIAKGTLIIMIIMSAATWYVLVTKLIQQQGLLSQAKATRRFWESKDLTEGLKVYKESSAFRAVAEEGILAAKQHAARTGEKVDLSDWVAHQLQRTVEQVSGQLQTGLSTLATVGSCSPFVGLFGTVWGIYHALIAIGITGQASIDKVAGPVGEALIMTAIGLGVAVPAVLAYNWLVRRNKVIVESLRKFAGDIHANLAMGVRGGQ
ncbi:MotA/TolQ/ExbB proton channel family protein [Cellvibrio mixtus]|uniref:MotA/TolQ/ExbB proton channel family protein n=1 Tax=Cellvibrio mixtus TaxID=39650 RepID=UPI000A02D43E|nr:MotA/TolQ/ExbB proton channel family protein [Cellvibrio mixtus]